MTVYHYTWLYIIGVGVGGLWVTVCGLYICWLCHYTWLYFIGVGVGGLWVTLHSLYICWLGPAPLDKWLREWLALILAYLKYWLLDQPQPSSSLWLIPLPLGQSGGNCSWIMNKLSGLHDPICTRNLDFCLSDGYWESRGEVQGAKDRKAKTSVYKLQHVYILWFMYAQSSARKELVGLKQHKISALCKLSLHA